MSPLRAGARLVTDEHVVLVSSYGVAAYAAGSGGGIYVVMAVAYAVAGAVTVAHHRREHQHRPSCYGRHASCRSS